MSVTLCTVLCATAVRAQAPETDRDATGRDAGSPRDTAATSPDGGPALVLTKTLTHQTPPPPALKPSAKAPAGPPAPTATKAVVKPPPPKPPTEDEKIAAFLKKKQYDQACPLLERLAHAAPNDAGRWNELALCEQHRGKKKAAIEDASHAAEVGARPARKTAYEILQTLRTQVEVPTHDCEWLSEGAGGVCTDQMWACGYDWDHPTAAGQAKGHALTFGIADDERDVLETALQDGTALKPQLAAEWKALQDQRNDEMACPLCHRRAIDSADGLVNARAVACFLQKNGRSPSPEICTQADADCDSWTNCIDDAASLARRADSEKNRALWPEAYDVIAAAHKVCDATCGVVETTRCTVVAVDACRGLVGYTCVHTRRGRRPTLRVGELSVNDGSQNWEEPAEPPKQNL